MISEGSCDTGVNAQEITGINNTLKQKTVVLIVTKSHITVLHCVLIFDPTNVKWYCI